MLIDGAIAEIVLPSGLYQIVLCFTGAQAAAYLC